jgi:hypothetical protein
MCEVTGEGLVSGEWLSRELRRQAQRLLVLDCRAGTDYAESHVRGSVALAVPSIILRRLAAGKVELLSTIKCLELRSRVELLLGTEADRRGRFVLVGDSTEPAGHQGETIHVFARRLRSCGGQVATLEGTYPRAAGTPPSPVCPLALLPFYLTWPSTSTRGRSTLCARLPRKLDALPRLLATCAARARRLTLMGPAFPSLFRLEGSGGLAATFRLSLRFGSSGSYYIRRLLYPYLPRLSINVQRSGRTLVPPPSSTLENLSFS